MLDLGVAVVGGVEIAALPQVRGSVVLPTDSATEGRPGVRRIRLQAADAEPPLRVLFAAGHRVEGLIVAEATLEEAFVHLTSPERAR